MNKLDLITLLRIFINPLNLRFCISNYQNGTFFLLICEKTDTGIQAPIFISDSKESKDEAALYTRKLLGVVLNTGEKISKVIDGVTGDFLKGVAPKDQILLNEEMVDKIVLFLRNSSEVQTYSSEWRSSLAA